MSLIVEDGSGLSTAESYSTVAEGDLYAANRLYSTDWTGASTALKEAALKQSSRVIDASVEFNGQAKTDTQALGWPRNYAIKAPRNLIPGFGGYFSYGFWPYQYGARFYDPDSIPKRLKDATCELAITLLKVDRTADTPGKGIKSFGIGQSAVTVTFDPGDARKLFTDVVYMLLRPFGSIMTAGGTRFIPTSRA